MIVYGVGNGISNMAVRLIESMYDFRFPDLDYSRMDIKPDVHTTRVLYKLRFPPRFEKMGRFSQRASSIHLTLEKLTVHYGYWEENCAKQQTRIAADFQ